MSKKDKAVKEVLEEVVEEKAPAVKAKMCKGQMPSPLVWYIRFHEAEPKVSAMAALYFTTPGKIVDITKANNQKYIVADMNWSDEDIAAAKAQVEANFVRGQAEEEAVPGSVKSRGLATTSAEDAEYSLAVLDSIQTGGTDGVNIVDARASYLEANPRNVAEKKEKVEEGDESVAEDDDGLEAMVG